MDNRVFLYLIPAVMLVSLLYVVVHFFVPPKMGVPGGVLEDSGPGCSAGETMACVTAQGCRGHRPCQLGNFGECLPDYECAPGDVEVCPYNVCTAGQKECGPCGRWGPCTAPPECGDGDYCSAENDSA